MGLGMEKGAKKLRATCVETNARCRLTFGMLRYPLRANENFAFRFDICEEEQQTKGRNGSANTFLSKIDFSVFPIHVAKGSLHLTWTFARARNSAPLSSTS